MLVNVDKLTYASNKCFSKTNHKNYEFVQLDILDTSELSDVFDRVRPRAVIHLAAETHVDRSIKSTDEFIKANLNGTHSVLKVCLDYCGWLNIAGGMWHCDTGRATINFDTLTAEREFFGPILGRRADIPFFAVATTVIKEESRWLAWYNRGLRWKKDQGKWEAVYGIHFACSNDGVNWDCGKELVIPFKDQYENSFGRPTVINFLNYYLMWFSARGAANDPLYKIGFAVSPDGQNWSRLDDLSGITPSNAGWDDQSVCYPFVFEYKNVFYMLFNGNQYGLTGFGYATMEKSALKTLLEQNLSEFRAQ